MTAEQLKAIKERAEAATPGPWDDYMNTVSEHDRGGNDVRSESNLEGRVCKDLTVADALFVSRARQDVPDLLAEVERLQAIVARLNVTADGVPIVPGMTVYDRENAAFVGDGLAHCHWMRPSNVYSSRKAALAANGTVKK